MVGNDNLHIVELDGSDSHLLHAAAVTVCRSFSEDPLIRWLRPHGAPWGLLHDEALSWQQRRLQRACIENRVYAIRCDANGLDHQESNDIGEPAIGLLCPPKMDWLRLMSLLPRYLGLCIREHLWAVHDSADMQRVGIMMAHHESGMKKIQAITHQAPWYIEVVAVDPFYQGKKLGSKMLNHLLAECPPGVPVYLECTNESNVGFYKKFGFKVLEEVILRDHLGDGSEEVKLWPMVKI